nr:MAG TPA: hypothetical protein [Caudoviricetes sp.]
MTDKECSEMIVKAVDVQICIENIDMHHEWICDITEKLKKLDVMKLHCIHISGYTEEEGDTDVDIVLNPDEEGDTDVDIVLNPDEEEDMVKLIKEKLEKVIQGHRKSISNEYEKLNNLLK